MNGNIKLLLLLISFGILIWASITNSIARAIIGIGIWFLVGADSEDWNIKEKEKKI